MITMALTAVSSRFSLAHGFTPSDRWIRLRVEKAKEWRYPQRLISIADEGHREKDHFIYAIDTRRPL